MLTITVILVVLAMLVYTLGGLIVPAPDNFPRRFNFNESASGMILVIHILSGMLVCVITDGSLLVIPTVWAGGWFLVGLVIMHLCTHYPLGTMKKEVDGFGVVEFLAAFFSVLVWFVWDRPTLAFIILQIGVLAGFIRIWKTDHICGSVGKTAAWVFWGLAYMLAAGAAITHPTHRNLWITLVMLFTAILHFSVPILEWKKKNGGRPLVAIMPSP
jgi:hypothetical protein